MTEELAEELVAHAKAAKRHRLAYEREIAAVRELLPAVRKQDPKRYGPRVLEGMVEGELERGTISRLTAAAVGTSRKPRQDPGQA